MRSCILFLLVGLLAPGASLPLRPCQNVTGDSGCLSADCSTSIECQSPKDRDLKKHAKIRCFIVDMASKYGLGEESLNPDQLEVPEERGAVYIPDLNVAVTIGGLLPQKTFNCKLEYPDVAVSVTEAAANATGSEGKRSTRPRMYLFPPHPEMLATTNRSAQEPTVTLICMIQGFYTADIAFQWLQNGSALPEENYVNTPVMKDVNDSYFRYSKMTTLAQHWETGGSFTCRVEHESLPMKFIQRSVEKSQGTK